MRRSYPRHYSARQTPLGKLLKEARIKMGISQAQLADRIGVSRPFLSQLETGKYFQPSPATLQSIAAELHLSVDDLHAFTGYTMPSDLPEYEAYLHAKYQLPDEAIAQLISYFEYIQSKYAQPQAGGRSPA